MNRLIRYIFFIIFIVVSFYYAWSEGDRKVSEREYDTVSAQVPPLVVRSLGFDHNAGNIVAIQPFINVLDYSSEERFYNKIDSYLLNAKKKGYLNENTIVAFPEHIGTGLVLLGEKKSVYFETSLSSAFTQMAFSNLISYLGTSFSKSHDSQTEIIFKMKALEMKNAYQETFKRLSSIYKVTIIAGSILLPEPELDKTKNNIQLKYGKIKNTSFIFLPTGTIYEQIGGKEHLSTSESKISVSHPEKLKFKNILTLLSNDSLYNSSYGEKGKDSEIVLVLAATLQGDTVDWKMEDIWGGKDQPDLNLTQAELWRKYSVFDKTKNASGNKITLQVVMLGKIFDIVLEGETSAIIRYVATEGIDNKSPAILNVWF